MDKQGSFLLAAKDLIDNGIQGAGYPCGVQNIKNKLNEEEKAVLENLITETKVPVSAILKLLKDNGFVAGDNTIRKHRRKECRCAK